MKILSLALVLFSATLTATPLKWSLVDVSFKDGGKATGWFIFDAATKTPLEYAIKVTGGDTGTFPDFLYKNGTAHNSGVFYVGWIAEPYFLFTTDIPGGDYGGKRGLRIAPEELLTDAGGTIDLDLDHLYGAECFNCVPYREFAGGAVSSEVPEPSTVLLCSAALLAFTCRRFFGSNR